MLTAEDEAEILELVGAEVAAYQAFLKARDALKFREAELGGSLAHLASTLKGWESARAPQLKAQAEALAIYEEARKALDAALTRMARRYEPDPAHDVSRIRLPVLGDQVPLADMAASILGMPKAVA